MNDKTAIKVGCAVGLLMSVTMTTPSSAISPASATSATSASLAAISPASAISASLAATSLAQGPLDAAAERYRPELAAAVEQCLTGAQTMRERILAKDLEGARKAWVASRVGWERSEVFTSGFTSELDAAIDAWPSAVTGFHYIEARLFGAQQMDVMPATDALIFHLSNLRMMVRGTPLTGQGMLEGTAKLAYEIGESKADGGESRFSGTSLDDMRNNADGIETAYRLVFASELNARDPALGAATSAKIKQLQEELRPKSLSDIDSDKVRTTSEDVVLSLQKAATALGLQRPSLSDLAQQ